MIQKLVTEPNIIRDTQPSSSLLVRTCGNNGRGSRDEGLRLASRDLPTTGLGRHITLILLQTEHFLNRRF